MRIFPIALGALTCSACAALPYSGVALEAYAGAARMTPDDDASADAERGTGMQLGLALSVEIDYIRSSGMGAGYAYVRSSLPTRTGSGELGIGAAQYSLASAFTSLTSDAIRARIYLGAQLGRTGYDDLLMGSYLGAGASMHPARGYAVHVFTGPQAMLVENNREDLAYRGLGWFVRARLYRSFFKSCDVPPSVAAQDRQFSLKPVECR